MFYIYADGKSIFQPMDNSLSLFTPKLTLEMGKAGALSFQIPPSNRYYNALPQLTTMITVEMDDVEIFRGRVLTNNRNFNNVRTVYCEGDLAYLVDTVQKAERYNGKTHDLFRKIIEAHNKRAGADKQFLVGDITIETGTWCSPVSPTRCRTKRPVSSITSRSPSIPLRMSGRTASISFRTA